MPKESWVVSSGVLVVDEGEEELVVIASCLPVESLAVGSYDRACRTATRISALPEYEEAAVQALSDLEWIEKTLPKSNLRSSILLLRNALTKGGVL